MEGGGKETVVKRKVKRKIKKRARFLKCPFCKEGFLPDYKEPETLKRFVSERGKILSRSHTGVCAKHQRKLAREIKRARYLALLRFVAKVF